MTPECTEQVVLAGDEQGRNPVTREPTEVSERANMDMYITSLGTSSTIQSV